MNNLFTSKRKGKFKLIAKFMEIRPINDAIINVVLFDSKKKYCFTAFSAQLPYYNTLIKNETVIVRFNIESKEYNQKYFTNMVIVQIEKKADLDRQKLSLEQPLKPLFQNQEFDN